MRASPAEYKSARPYAHAGASSQLQLGAPPQPGFAAEVGLFAWRSSAGELTFTWQV